ncbi:hypothetical protein FOXYSP1_07513, partial [Fusarium oxysporum f. sp. phaseoli]
SGARTFLNPREQPGHKDRCLPVEVQQVLGWYCCMQVRISAPVPKLGQILPCSRGVDTNQQAQLICTSTVVLSFL